MSDIHLFMLLVLIVTSLLALFIRKKFAIDTYFPYRPVNNTHKWVNRILLFLIVLSIVLVFVFSYPEIYLLLFIGFIIIQNGFDAYMEYKHEREEKVYLVNLVWTIGILITFFGFMFFLFKTKTIEEVFRDYESFHLESIEQLEIQNNAWDKEEIIYKRETNTEDKQMIEKLFSELSKLEVRNSYVGQGNQDNFYKLYMVEGDIFSIGIYDKYITIDSEDFRVVGDNPIYKMLEEAEIDWVYKE